MNRSQFGASTKNKIDRSKMTESQLLERDAKEMEKRLKALQEKMKLQEEEDAALARPGGTRWGSARPDRGTATMYNRDMQEKHKKRASNTNYKENIEASAYKTPTDADMISSKKSSSSRNNSKDNTSKSKQSQMRQQSQEEKVTKQVESWNLDEVGGWLESLGFGQYVQVFKTNDITGSILLDLSLEDLDYMEIKILGHRKILLKSIDQLRRGKMRTRSEENLMNTPMVSKSLEDIDLNQRSVDMRGMGDDMTSSLDSSTMAIGEARNKAESASSSQKKKHWSQLNPIANNSIIGDGSMSVNPGDGVLDEAAEQRAFMEAVMEWRRGASVEAVTAADQQDEKEAEQDNMWHNPWSSAPPIEEEKGSADLQKLSEMELDEEKERAAFAAAVTEWRNSNSTSNDSNNNSSSNQDNNGVGSGSDGPIKIGGPSAQEKADRLAAQLEAEHEANTKLLAARRSEMERKLNEASLEKTNLQEIRSKLEAAKVNDSDSDDDDSNRNRRVIVEQVESTIGTSEDVKEDYYVVEESDSD